MDQHRTRLRQARYGSRLIPPRSRPFPPTSHPYSVDVPPISHPDPIQIPSRSHPDCVQIPPRSQHLTDPFAAASVLAIPHAFLRAEPSTLARVTAVALTSSCKEIACRWVDCMQYATLAHLPLWTRGFKTTPAPLCCPPAAAISPLAGAGNAVAVVRDREAFHRDCAPASHAGRKAVEVGVPIVQGDAEVEARAPEAEEANTGAGAGAHRS